MAHKRRGSIHVGLPWRGLLPPPDGTISNLDRRQAAYCYPLVVERLIVQVYEVPMTMRRLQALTGYIQEMTEITGNLRRILTDGS